MTYLKSILSLILLLFAMTFGQGMGEDLFTRITSEGPLKIDYEKKIAKFEKNVVLKDDKGLMKSDFLKVFFDKTGNAIHRMIANGNVVIDQKEHYSQSDKAEFLATEKKLVLTGNPVIKKGMNYYSAEIITIFTDTNKVVFEPSARIVVKKDETQS